MVLRALKQSLCSNRLRLKPLETSDQHVLHLRPWSNCSWPKRGVPSLGNILDCHDEGFRHDYGIASIRRYGCFVAHQELLRIWVPIIHGELRWLVWCGPWGSLQFCWQRRSIIESKISMMEIIIPLIIIIEIVLTKLSALRSSVLVILSEMSYFLSSFVDLLLQIREANHLLLLSMDLLMDGFEVPYFLVQLLLLRRWTCSLPFLSSGFTQCFLVDV
jgi:hypothetical protein